MATERYDIIIVGGGAAGGALARTLAPGGKKILVLERGPWLPRERRNWDPVAVAVKGCYENAEEWLDGNGRKIHTNCHYNVGGNSKFWGAALFRLRERDFEKVVHPDGISPEWPLKYRDFEPYYARAEKMYDVRGKRGVDPTEPPIREEYPYPPIPHEPRIQQISDALRKMGYAPFHLPTAIRRDEETPFLSECIRCNTCDGFPCLVNAKADGELNGIRPAVSHPNVRLLTGVRVSRLLTGPSGREVTGVETETEGKIKVYKGDIVVVSCGAINSAALLLRSANDRHPRGLANGSDQVGRNYMYHLLGFMIAVSRKPNPTDFQKSIGLNDFYWGEKGYDFPMGNIQTTGKILPEMLEGILKKPVKGKSFAKMASHSTDWWFMTEDVPDPDNRITWEKGTVKIRYRENNRASFDRFRKRWVEILKRIGECDYLAVDVKVDITNVAHQCGTCRFGTDPKTSVLDLTCRAHEVDNLYVVDTSFYPSSAALNPTHTLLANALRVGDHLLERMK